MLETIKKYTRSIVEKELQEPVSAVCPLEGHTCTAESVLENVLGKDVSYYDYSILNPTERKLYVADAKAVLRNSAFTNEIKHLITDLIVESAKRAPSFDEVRFIRATINGLEVLVERLQSIENDTKRPPSEEDVFDGI